jgi:hypothetical protein
MNKPNTKQDTEIQYCPVLTCSSVLLFPEYPIPCGKHGTVMVNYSELPLEKRIYMRIKELVLKRQYVVRKVKTNGY